MPVYHPGKFLIRFKPLPFKLAFPFLPKPQRPFLRPVGPKLTKVLLQKMCLVKSFIYPQEVCHNIEQILNSPADFFAKVSSSLRTTLSALTSGSTGRIIGKSLVNEFIKRFEEGKRVYCFVTLVRCLQEGLPILSERY